VTIQIILISFSSTISKSSKLGFRECKKYFQSFSIIFFILASLLWLNKTIFDGLNSCCIFTITKSQESIFGSIESHFALTAINLSFGFFKSLAGYGKYSFGYSSIISGHLLPHCANQKIGM
jgi:hypothetical protein